MMQYLYVNLQKKLRLTFQLCIFEDLNPLFLTIQLQICQIECILLTFIDFVFKSLFLKGGHVLVSQERSSLNIFGLLGARVLSHFTG